MKILATSDWHGYSPEIPQCDVLLMAGDYERGFRDREFLLGPFSDRLRAAPAGLIVGIAGNHDWEFQKAPEGLQAIPWTYLQDSGATVDGLSVYGTPWTPKFYNWAFMAEDDDLRPVFGRIPKGLDVLISHGPPKGILDKNDRGYPCGSQALWDRVKLVQPRVHIFGHIHEARGFLSFEWPSGKRTMFINVSHVDAQYRPNGGPVDISEFL